jgi:hypothetical protein
MLPAAALPRTTAKIPFSCVPLHACAVVRAGAAETATAATSATSAAFTTRV